MDLLLPQTSHGNILCVAVLLMFYAALRQSKVMSPSISSFDNRKHFSRGDVSLSSDAMTIYIKHTKNMQTVYQHKTVHLQTASNPLMYSHSTQGNVYQYTDHHPHWSMYHVSITQTGVSWLGEETLETTLGGSIRKAAATAAHHQGCQENKIQSSTKCNST